MGIAALALFGIAGLVVAALIGSGEDDTNRGITAAPPWTG